jgi:uncharacterized protein YqeY
MSLLQTIKAAQLQARKDRNTIATNVLTTLIGEAEAIGKTAGNRETTDSEVVALAKKFIKGVDETLGLVKHPDAVTGLQAERALLTQFLPKQMSSEELTVALKAISDELNAHTLRDMGKIMKVLKERYDGQYDGAAASTTIKGMLT